MAKKNSAQSLLMWMLMALLIAGLGGFGIDGFLSQRVTTIGTVGDRPITAQAYSRALQSEIRAFEQQVRQPVTFAMAQAMGLDARVRSQLIIQAALENEVERIGISVGDEQVSRRIAATPAFQGPTGDFDLATYRFQLQSAGLTVAEFEESMRIDAARGILQAATAAGIETPANLRVALLDHYARRHSFDLFALTEADLPAPVEEPGEAAITAFYAANIARFTAPETRHITYAWITPDMIRDSVEVDEASIRALYDQRIDEFVQPERRLVERLVFGTEAEAQAAMDRLAAGSASFDVLVTERGLTLDDADMGDVSEAELGAAGPAVFALAEPGEVAGPFLSNLGPAIFRMNAILNAQETPFDEAREALHGELAADRARRAIAEQQEGFDDLLAGGATLEDLAAETPMELGQIDWSSDSSEGIAAYTEFAQAAATAAADDFPELIALSDGGLVALRLDSLTPPTPRPLDEVRDLAAAGARAEAVVAALTLQAQSLLVDLATQGPEAFAEARGLVPERFEGVTRLDRLPQLPPAMAEALFGAPEGTTSVQQDAQRVLIGLAGPSLPADPEDAQTRQLADAINEQIGDALAQDVFTYFARALQAESGITLNQAAIDAVNASFR